MHEFLLLRGRGGGIAGSGARATHPQMPPPEGPTRSALRGRPFMTLRFLWWQHGLLLFFCGANEELGGIVRSLLTSSFTSDVFHV